MGRFQQDEHDSERESRSVITRRTDGLIKIWNDSAEKLYGWRKDEALGRVSHDLLQTQFPKPLEEIESELVRTGRWEGMLIHTTRAGDRLPVESLWILDPTLQPGTVVEIIKRSRELETRGDNHPVETGGQEPVVPTTKRTDKISKKLNDFTNIVLIAGGSLCVLALLYSAYDFAGRNQISLDRIVTFVVLPGILATVLFAGLRLQPRQKIGLYLLLFSTGVSIYTLELFLSFLGSTAPPAEWFAHKSPQEKHEIAKRFGVDFDTGSRFEVIKGLRKQGIDAEPYASASILLQKQANGSVSSQLAINGAEIVPLGGISNTVTVLCNETGDHVIYKSDEHGFNNPKGIWDADVKIAVIGDSFAHGSCVPPDKNFVALIRKQYPGTINLGGGGQGPLLMLATLKEYVQYMRPPLVLWFYFEGNDIENLRNEQANPILARYLEESGFSQNLRDRQSDIDRVLRAFIERAREQIASDGSTKVEILPRISRLREMVFVTMTLTHLRRKLQTIYETRNKSEREALVNLFGKVLLDAKLSVEAWGGKLYFVYLPQWERYARPDLADEDRERVLSLVKDMGIRGIDLHEAFQAQGDPLELFPFRQNAHYDETGNQLVAKEVLRVISVNPSR